MSRALNNYTAKCSHCDTVFNRYVPPSHRPHKIPKFCSRKCYSEGQLIGSVREGKKQPMSGKSIGRVDLPADGTHPCLTCDIHLEKYNKELRRECANCPVKEAYLFNFLKKEGMPAMGSG